MIARRPDRPAIERTPPGLVGDVGRDRQTADGRHKLATVEPFSAPTVLPGGARASSTTAAASRSTVQTARGPDTPVSPSSLCPGSCSIASGSVVDGCVSLRRDSPWKLTVGFPGSSGGSRGSASSWPDRVVHVQPDEPAEPQGAMECFHQQPLTPDRVEHLQQQCAQQLLRPARRSAATASIAPRPSVPESRGADGRPGAIGSSGARSGSERRVGSEEGSGESRKVDQACSGLGAQDGQEGAPLTTCHHATTSEDQMILDSQRPSGDQMTPSSHRHPWPQTCVR